jgi:hypothetical protein
MMVDGQFETLRRDLVGLGIAVNCVSRDEHVREIERHIRTIKERTRCIYNQLPFKKIPARITIEMVYSSNFWLNMFPPTDGVSKTMSPRAIIAGGELDYPKHCRLEFGAYCQVHEEHDNSMATRTTGAIALRPTGNIQGGYYFFSRATGRRLNPNRWTELPMPADVIDRVHILARRGLALEGLSFADRNGNVQTTPTTGTQMTTMTTKVMTRPGAPAPMTILTPTTPPTMISTMTLTVMPLP